jgi:RNA-directed DNA polymerase
LSLKDGSFRPLPVRQRRIPKPGGSGKLRSLGIPTVTDRVVQAALKLVLEPIFEADFLSVSYGFRPNRRAHDAIADIHHFGTFGYHWVLDADIEACFDRIDHSALMDRVRLRVKDKRVLGLVKAFLKAGLLTELGEHQDTHTGTPQGGILSPLLANIALSVLDEHAHAPWQPGGDMSTTYWRAKRRRSGLPNWRIVRYADDFAVLVDGSREDALALREDIGRVLATMGLRFSESKTQVVHLDEGFDFLGFRIRRRRKRGSDQWFVYTFIADRPVRSVKDKIRALTNRTSAAQSRGRADPSWSDPARLVQLLPARRVQTHLQQARAIHLVAGSALAEGTAPMEVDGIPPSLHRPPRAVESPLGGWDRVVQHRRRTGHPVPATRQPHPHPLDGANPRLTK